MGEHRKDMSNTNWTMLRRQARQLLDDWVNHTELLTMYIREAQRLMEESESKEEFLEKFEGLVRVVPDLLKTQFQEVVLAFTFGVTIEEKE